MKETIRVGISVCISVNAEVGKGVSISVPIHIWKYVRGSTSVSIKLCIREYKL